MSITLHCSIEAFRVSSALPSIEMLFDTELRRRGRIRLFNFVGEGGADCLIKTKHCEYLKRL